MKKVLKIICLILSIVIVYFSGITIFNRVFCKAYIDFGTSMIKYEGETYYNYKDLYDYEAWNGESSNISGILTGTLTDYMFFPREYIYYLNEVEDANTNFIVFETFLDPIVYVKEGFRFPDIKDDTVEAVWFSWDTDTPIVRDENIIYELVECAVAGQSRPLSKQLYEMISEGGAISCFLKFKDYPITANFDVVTTKAGAHYLMESDGMDRYTVFFEEDFLEEQRARLGAD